MDLLNEGLTDYMQGLQARHDDDVLLAMEAEAAERRFPIVGRLCGVTLQLLAQSINARRVFELGSGYGYSAMWFTRVASEVHCTDGDPNNAAKAEEYLKQAGAWDRVDYHVGDALTEFAKVDGDFDIVYNDVDKEGYPDCWKAAKSRVRVGGYYICDNVLWQGRVVTPADDTTRAIVEHNRLVSSDPNWLSTIVPLRDGLIVALRLS